jgi:hypothetical protein
MSIKVLDAIIPFLFMAIFVGGLVLIGITGH